MSETSKIPSLRFPEFDKEWESKYLGDVCRVKTGNKDTQNRIQGGKYPFFVRSNTVERINTYSFDGEAILTSGDGVGVGKNFHYINGKFDYHQRVYALRDFGEDYNGKFIYHVFSEKFYKRVLRLSAKNSVDSVRMDFISKMKIGFPTLPEQQKIASFLTAVDTKIEQLTKKKALLEQYKKGVMQKIFSQEIRFKTENGKEYPDWEEKKLGDNINIISGYPFKSELFRNEGLKLVTPKNFTKNGSGNFTPEFTKFTTEKVDERYICSEGDLLILLTDLTQSCELLGKPLLIKKEDGKVLLNQRVIKVETNETLDRAFLANFLLTENYHKRIKETSSGSTVRHSSNKIINEILINLPSIQEQTQIANFLSTIDDKIGLISTRLENTQQFKKGLLQQMFV